VSRVRVASLSLLFALSACQFGTIDSVEPGDDDQPDDAGDTTTGADGDDGGQPGDPGDPDEPAPPPPPPAYLLEVGAPLEPIIELGQSTQFVVTLTSQNGFDGGVSLAVEGAPESWLLSFDPADQIVLEPNDSVDVVVSIDVASNAEAADATLDVTANSVLGPQTGQVALSVLNELTIAIAANVGEGQHNFPGTTAVRPGTAVKFVNADSIEHRIHSNRDDENFPHQPDRLAPGEVYVVTPVDPDNYNFYCHEHEVAAGVGRIVVEALAEPAE